MKGKKNILVCPLDWGLGHVTRCIPIIRELLKNQHTVFVATNTAGEILLKKEFPNITFIPFAGYNIRYGASSLSSFLQLLISGIKIGFKIKQEHKRIKKIIENYNINLIISDNRYGLYHDKIPSVLITHQLLIKIPFGQKYLQKILAYYIRPFQQCWIPDVKEKEQSLSADLSHEETPLPNNYKFIGPLSRFHNMPITPITIEKKDIFIILSGPEPQRSILEKKLLKALQNNTEKIIMVRGLPQEKNIPSNTNKNLIIFNHLDTNTFYHYLKSSEIIIARSGYSTLMDLAYFKKKAILIPTPNQPEQLYLAKYHHGKNHCFMQKQKNISLEKALAGVQNTLGMPKINFEDLTKVID